MKRVLLGIAITVCALLPSRPLHSQFAVDTLSVVRQQVVAQPISSVTLPDGSLVVADFGSKSVFRIDSMGKLLWHRESQGGGPGEWRVPYRVAVENAGTLLVLDVGNQRFTRLDVDGNHIEDVTPEMPLFAHALLPLPRGRVAMTAITRDPRGVGKAVHLFDERLRHLGSCSPFDASLSPDQMRAVGPGSLSKLAGSDSFGHLTMQPYGLREISEDCSVGPFRLFPTELSGVSATYGVRSSGTRVQTTINPSARRPRTPILLADGRWLAGWLSIDEGGEFSVVDQSMNAMNTYTQPAEWGSWLAYDRDRDVHWILSEDEALNPVLLRVAIRW